MTAWYERWKPRTSKRGLLVISGAMWGTAGTILLARGYLFLPDTTGDHIVLGNLALFLGILFFRFVFSSLTERNIGRIEALSIARPCLFSFQTWKGHGVMAAMITAGVAVRMSGFIAPAGLGTIYIAMSIPLIVSSFKFLQAGFRYQQETVGHRTFTGGV